LSRSPLPLPIALLRATLLQSRHEFPAAEAALHEILMRDPGQPLAWLTLATVATVQAEFDLARHACARLLTTADRLSSLGCIAGVGSVTGQAEQAYRLLAQELPLDSAADRPTPSQPDAETLAWIAGLAAEAALRTGRIQEAEQHFRHALALTPGDNFLLAGYADFLLDEDRPGEVIALLGDERRSDTSFLRLVLAEAALGRPEAARDGREMAARFAALHRRGDHVYGREQARFVLAIERQPARAL
jgi:predicted Zn-dependent protease